MLGIRTFMANAPQCVALIGSGTQSVGHAQALAALYPGLSVAVVGSSLASAQAFVNTHSHLDLLLTAVESVPEQADVVITLTTSSVPVSTQPARVGRLIVDRKSTRLNSSH